MKMFAGSIYASKTIDGIIRETMHTAVVIQSVDSLAAAHVKAIELALDRWPKEDGWGNHTEETLEIEIINTRGNI